MSILASAFLLATPLSNMSSLYELYYRLLGREALHRFRVRLNIILFT